MFTFAFHLRHCFSKMANLPDAETTLQFFRRDHPNPICGTVLDDAQPARMIEKTAQGADGASCRAYTAGCLSSASRTAVTRRLADRDVSLQALNICEHQVRNDPRPDQWLDMLFNSASIPGYRRCLDRTPIATKQTPAFSLSKIPVANFGNG
jgi:hypothetical protein